jgi:hypothetical protein
MHLEMAALPATSSSGLAESRTQISVEEAMLVREAAAGSIAGVYSTFCIR